jgi:hypothetical protein
MRKPACLPDQSYHVVLAVNRAASSFRGINGALPAKRVPPFIPRSAPHSVDRCARRDAHSTGNPAQHCSERVMRQSSNQARRRCTICLSEFEVGTGGINESEVMGWGLCPEHRDLFGDGFVAVIECDIAKSGNPAVGDFLDPDKVHRTGVIAYIERKTLVSTFKMRLDPVIPAVYVARGTVAKLQGCLLRPH